MATTAAVGDGRHPLQPPSSPYELSRAARLQPVHKGVKRTHHASLMSHPPRLTPRMTGTALAWRVRSCAAAGDAEAELARARRDAAQATEKRIHW